MKIKKNGKVINLTESEIKKMIKWLDDKNKKTLNEQVDPKTLWKSIPSDTTIFVSNTNLVVKSDKNKVYANYYVNHNQIGEMEVSKVNFNKSSGYLELTLLIPYGKGAFVKPKIEDPNNQAKMSKAGIYAQHIKGSGFTSNDKLYLKVDLNRNPKALKAILNATEQYKYIDLGEGFTLKKG
jgi:hypothetical protein